MPTHPDTLSVSFSLSLYRRRCAVLSHSCSHYGIDDSCRTSSVMKLLHAYIISNIHTTVRQFPQSLRIQKHPRSPFSQASWRRPTPDAKFIQRAQCPIHPFSFIRAAIGSSAPSFGTEARGRLQKKSTDRQAVGRTGQVGFFFSPVEKFDLAVLRAGHHGTTLTQPMRL